MSEIQSIIQISPFISYMLHRRIDIFGNYLGLNERQITTRFLSKAFCLLM